MRVIGKAKKIIALSLIGALSISNVAIGLTANTGSNENKKAQLAKRNKEVLNKIPKLSPWQGLMGNINSSTIKSNALNIIPRSPFDKQVNNKENFVKGEILVKFNSNFNKQNEIYNSLGLTLLSKNQLGYYRLKVQDPNNIEKVLAKLNANINVKSAQPNYIYQVFDIDEPRYEEQWGPQKIKAPEGWKISKGSPKIVLAIVDTGVDTKHPEFKDRIVPGYNSISPLKSFRDDYGHGTHVAGIAAAALNNNLGIAGIAPNVKIMPVKVLDSMGGGNDYTVADGIKWAADHGANIMNLSLGTYSYSKIIDDAIQYAYGKGVTIVAAAGNAMGEMMGYPAALPNVLAVSATDKEDKLAFFSSYGNETDVAAPGMDIFSTLWTYQKGSTYGSLSGTSMASPHVAGVAALVLSVNPKLKPLEVQQIIEESSDDLSDLGWDKQYGYGRVNLEKALTLAKNFAPEKDGNDQLDDARNISSSQEVTGSFSSAYDVDWYKINLTEKGALDIRGEVASSQDIAFEIYNDKQELLTNINYAPKGSLERSTIQNLNPGDYFIKAKEFVNQWNTGEYKLSATFITEGSLLVDTNEPNDDQQTATVLTLDNDLNGEIKGIINKSKDQDWYKVTLKEGDNLNFRVSPVEGMDPVVTVKAVLTPSEEPKDPLPSKAMDSIGIGNGIIVEDPSSTFDSKRTGEGEEGTINSYGAGDYYISIKDSKDNILNQEYTLKLERNELSTTVDPFEPNNIPQEATKLELDKKLDGAYLGNSMSPDDLDWYTLDVKEKGMVNITISNVKNMDVWAEIYDQDILTKGEQEARPVGYLGGWMTDEIKGKFKANPGKYYIRVMGWSWNNTNQSYGILANWENGEFDQYEINDTPEKATPFEVGSTFKANLNPEQDVDYYKVKLADNKTIAVSSQAPAGLDTSLIVLKENKQTYEGKEYTYYDYIQFIDSGKEGQLDGGVFKTIGEGNYIIGIAENYGKQSKEKYSLNIDDFTMEKDNWENNDTLKQAKLISLNNEITPTLISAEDEDWFQIKIPKTGTVDIALSMPKELDGILEVYNEKGKLIVKEDEVAYGDKEIVRLHMPAGKFYIKVSEALGNGSITKYSLKTKYSPSAK